MPFKITPNVDLKRDDKGVVRRLRHPGEAYTREAAGLADAVPGASDPRSMAESYLRDIRLIVDLPDSMLANFDGAIETDSTTDADTQLRLLEEKRLVDTAAVTYAQTQMGIPVWNSGVTVRVQLDPMRVTGMLNAMQYDVEVESPGADGLLPGNIDSEVLARCLGLTQGPEPPPINGKRLLIYRYDPEERLDPAAVADGEAKPFQQAPPALDLPPVAEELHAGKHYVVTEVMFSLPVEGFDKLNWRAFVESGSGSVLYLRALIASATGCVFEADPITQAGGGFSGASPNAVLNPLRSSRQLPDLDPPGPPQELRGELVELVDTQRPTAAPPTEPAPFDFRYDAQTTDFAAVNAYAHCNGIFRFIESMGFNLTTYFDGTSFPVPVDHLALGGAVNAQAPGNSLGNGSGGFLFGVVQSGQTLGMAAAVRIVWHEFGHALLWDNVSSPNFGWAHSAGDSLGAILFDPASQAPDRFASFPFLLASNPGLGRRHDRDVASGWAFGGARDDTQYGSEQVLSTALFRLYRAIGGDDSALGEREATSRYVAFLIIKAIGTLSFTTRDPEVYVDALMDSDVTTGTFEAWRGGAIHKIIRWTFERQGLYLPAGAPLPNTSAGGPPTVDVYIDDGRAGEYMPFLGGLGDSLDIWNRRAPDGGIANERPIRNQRNFLYVRVKNRGANAANNVEVRAFKARRGLPVIWPTRLRPLRDPRLSIPGPIPPGGEAILGPFRWRPRRRRDQVLMSVSADGDLSNLETVTGEYRLRRLVPFDNNLATRRFQPRRRV